MNFCLLGFLLLTILTCGLAKIEPLTEEEREIERQKLEEFRKFFNFAYYEFVDKDFKCKIESSMTRFYDIATDKCSSCEENENLSDDFCTVQDQIKTNKLEITRLHRIIRKQENVLNKEITQNENFINSYKTLSILMAMNSIFLLIVDGVGFILYQKNKVTRFKENKHYSSEVALLTRQIEQLQNLLKCSPKDDKEILKYERKRTLRNS